MPASLVEISIPRGLPVFRCPVTGVPVWTEDGFDETASQSPFIRFFVDWIGEAWVVPPTSLRGEDAAQQRALVAAMQVAEEVESELPQDSLMKQLAEGLPSSAVIFEVLSAMNPNGCGGGEICYVCFDFARANDQPQDALRLEHIDVSSN